jgi:ferredoxin|tara:strand:- start:39326 stop:39547 length:222 start_codon:yes stop_codon:yes gene_type:complete
MSNESANKVNKVYAELELCCGYGLCNSVCPDIYKLNSDGTVYLATDTVPDDLLDAAIEGADCCPAQVLKVVTD